MSTTATRGRDEPEQQVEERALTGAGRSDDPDRLAPLNRQIHAADRRPYARRIGIAHVVELDGVREGHCPISIAAFGSRPAQGGQFVDEIGAEGQPVPQAGEVECDAIDRRDQTEAGVHVQAEQRYDVAALSPAARDHDDHHHQNQREGRLHTDAQSFTEDIPSPLDCCELLAE